MRAFIAAIAAVNLVALVITAALNVTGLYFFTAIYGLFLLVLCGMTVNMILIIGAVGNLTCFLLLLSTDQQGYAYVGLFATAVIIVECLRELRAGRREARGSVV